LLPHVANPPPASQPVVFAHHLQKEKKSTRFTEQLTPFMEQLTPVVEQLTPFMEQMTPFTKQ
jgi:hypothetical protein